MIRFHISQKDNFRGLEVVGMLVQCERVAFDWDDVLGRSNARHVLRHAGSPLKEGLRMPQFVRSAIPPLPFTLNVIFSRIFSQIEYYTS